VPCRRSTNGETAARRKSAHPCPRVIHRAKRSRGGELRGNREGGEPVQDSGVKANFVCLDSGLQVKVCRLQRDAPKWSYNPFPDMGGCAKLPWVRRGLRFTVSLRTGVVFFLAAKDSVTPTFGGVLAGAFGSRSGRKNSSIDDPGRAAVT